MLNISTNIPISSFSFHPFIECQSILLTIQTLIFVQEECVRQRANNVAIILGIIFFS